MAAPAAARTRRWKSRDGIETRDDIWYVGCRPSKRQMVCKRDWSVDRGGGSPMTRTGPADAVMPACGPTAAGHPALTSPGACGADELAPTRLARARHTCARYTGARLTRVRPAPGVPA